MTLALAHSHATPAFNGLYFATAATVIPVLFLVIAVQGRLYEDLMKTAVTALNPMKPQGMFRVGLRFLGA